MLNLKEVIFFLINLQKFKPNLLEISTAEMTVAEIIFRVSFIKKNHVTFNQIFIPTITLRSTRINQSQQDQYIPNVILVKVKSVISTYIPNNNNKLIFIIIKSIRLTRHRIKYRYPKLFMILSDRKDLQ